jgi:hypothetical protein
MSTDLSPKIPCKFECIRCDYITCNKKDFNKHLTTVKHKNPQKSTDFNKKSPNIPKPFMCECGKLYKERTGLWKHKKVCDNKLINTDDISDKELIMMLLKQNSELITQNAEFVKNGINNSNSYNNNTNNSHNNTNSHNKTFNLQFFLNETCKDAMNIMDFIDSIQLQLSDLVNVGKIGYVEGISNIINKNLEALDVTLRPVHCTDKKREVLYIKDENKWEKENETKTKMRKVIKHVAHKNSKLLPVFREKYPDCGKSISKYSEQFNKIVIEAMGGPGDNDSEKEDKIIANISKNVTIQKENEEK